MGETENSWKLPSKRSDRSASLSYGSRLTSYFTCALSTVELTRPVASLINRRRAGIKDLRFGYVVDDDWRDCDHGACLKSHRHNVPLLSSASHHSICATTTAGPRRPLGQIFGDFLVPPASAHGRHSHTRSIHFERDHCYHLGNSHHFDLFGAARALVEAAIRPSVISLCSGSALFGFPIAAGIPAGEVAAFTLGINPNQYVDVDWRLLASTLPLMGKGSGVVIPGERIEALYRRLLGDMTLGEMPIPAYAPIWNIEENRVEYIGPRTYPDLPVVRAIHMANMV